MAEETSDEYTVTFESKPFGMKWKSRNSDKKNLYVTEIAENTPAYHKNVQIGSKIVKFGNQTVENIGANEIFWHYKNNHDTLPLTITFRHIPVTTMIELPRMSVYQEFSPHPRGISPLNITTFSVALENKNNTIVENSMEPELINIDFSIFDNEDEKCDINDDDENVINNCSSLQRIVYALRYYQSLNTRQSKAAQSAFTQFISLKYKCYLDDIIHLTTEHEQHLELINKALLPENYFGNCDIYTCSLTARHCDVNEIDSGDEDSKMEPLFLFYQDTFDTIHYYLLHLFETGLRILQNDNAGDEKEADGLWSCVDALFFKKKLMLNIKRKKLAKFFDRFLSKGQNQPIDLPPQPSKFNIQTSLLFDEDDEETFIDELLEVIRNQQNVSNKEILSLTSYLIQEEFDTDALMGDINVNYNTELKASNILNNIEDQICSESLFTYIQETKLKESVFGTGFIFWYWPYYAKSHDTEPNEYEYWNYNDFNGYSMVELYIARGKYGNLKQEILNNDDNEVGMKEFHNLVVLKGKEYMETERVKQMKGKGTDGVYLYYDIPLGEPLNLAHLMALILRCDFSQLCASFSRTFRKLKANETLESVKTRNTNYWWMSKLIREAVNYYGINGDTGVMGVDYNKAHHEIGPFFCGIDTVLVLPSIAIRLCGPQSATKSQQVALNFAEEEGMILQLNNRYGGGGKHLRFFDVSWLSRYKEENERVFIGGTHLIQVESVTLSSTMENFSVFFNALYWFNSVIDGAQLFGMKNAFSKKDRKLISSLIAQKMSGIHNYILDTFNMFVISRKTIVINMDYLSRHCPPNVINLIFDSFVAGIRDKDKYTYNDINDNSNLLREQLLNTFTATTNVVIYCTNGDGDTSYIFSLCKLLNVLSLFTRRKIKCILNGVWKYTPDNHNDYYQRRSWLFYTYESMKKKSPSQLLPTLFHSSITQSIDPYYGKKQDTVTFHCL